MGTVDGKATYPARERPGGGKRVPAAHRKTMQIGGGKAERIENGNRILGAFVRGVSSRVMRLAAASMPARVNEDDLPARGGQSVDIAFLAPAMPVCGKAMEENEGRAGAFDLESNFRSVRGYGVTLHSDVLSATDLGKIPAASVEQTRLLGWINRSMELGFSLEDLVALSFQPAPSLMRMIRLRRCGKPGKGVKESTTYFDTGFDEIVAFEQQRGV
jgi:hypothetical protein